jgi:hypothetical protein
VDYGKGEDSAMSTTMVLSSRYGECLIADEELGLQIMVFLSSKLGLANDGNNEQGGAGPTEISSTRDDHWGCVAALNKDLHLNLLR